MPGTLIETLREIESQRPYAVVSDNSRDWSLEDLINSLGPADDTTFAIKETADGRILLYPYRWNAQFAQSEPDWNGQPWFTVHLVAKS